MRKICKYGLLCLTALTALTSVRCLACCAQAGSPLHRAVDLGQLAVVGHSRGAKLAALMLASDGGSNIAAVLIDPVDMTPVTEKMGYPSAVVALRGLGRNAAVIGKRCVLLTELENCALTG